MIFIVSGLAHEGHVSYTCRSAVSALSRAQGLRERGTKDILIADGSGRFVPPADFARRVART